MPWPLASSNPLWAWSWQGARAWKAPLSKVAVTEVKSTGLGSANLIQPPRGVVPRGTGGGCFGFLEVSCMIFQRGSSHPFSSYSHGLLGAGKLWGWGDRRWPRWRSDPGGTASGLISWKCTDLVWVSEALTDHRREEPHNDLAVNWEGLQCRTNSHEIDLGHWDGRFYELLVHRLWSYPACLMGCSAWARDAPSSLPGVRRTQYLSIFSGGVVPASPPISLRSMRPQESRLPGSPSATLGSPLLSDPHTLSLWQGSGVGKGWRWMN